MGEIRPATLADVPRMVELGGIFYQAARMGSIPYNPVSTACLFREMINSHLCGIFVVEHDGRIAGGIGGTVGPATYNFDCLVVLENFWFIDPEERGARSAFRLIDTLEQWSREQGAVQMIMGSFAHLKADTLDRLYQKRGYEMREYLHIKELMPWP